MNSAALDAVAIRVPDLLLPRSGVDLSRWAVVAADQYTSQRDYWARVDEYVGSAPSTLRLMLPEVYLDDADVDARIARIRHEMKRYLDDGVFAPPLRGLVYIDRKTSHAASRKGLVVALDLEHYDYHEGATTLVRATEKTVEARLPPRVKIRESALVELPHVMVLIDDPDRRVIEPLADSTRGARPIYDIELMENGGSIRGWSVTDDVTLERIAEGIAALASPATFRRRYGVESDDVLLYAMGDGNHSLASAKVHWEVIKRSLSGEALRSHPARHALVELVNVHDEGLAFEPIHRVVFGVDGDALLDTAPRWFRERGATVSVENAASAVEQRDALSGSWKRDPRHTVGFVTSKRRGRILIDKPETNLPVGSLQAFLDSVLRGSFPNATTDYIHGDEVVESLVREPDRIGFFLPPMNKSDLFKTVILDGALPRKTFSMGEADEKRFYLEARSIVP